MHFDRDHFLGGEKRGLFTQMIPDYDNHVVLRLDDMFLYPPAIYSHDTHQILKNNKMNITSKMGIIYDTVVTRYVYGLQPRTDERLLAKSEKKQDVMLTRKGFAWKLVTPYLYVPMRISVEAVVFTRHQREPF